MATQIIVFDTAVSQFLGNRVFDPSHAARFPGAAWIACLYERVTQRGWRMTTADVFLESRPDAGWIVSLSDMVTPYTERLLRQGIQAAVIWSGESPNVAWNFYHRLQTNTARYSHAFLFRGVRDRVKPPTRFHPFYWPNAQRQVLPGPAWKQREFLVAVVSNKQRFGVSNSKPLLGMRRLAKQIVWRYLQVVNPLFQFEDLYEKRLEAILYFAEFPGFRLFGSGWEQPRGLSEAYYQAAIRAGAVPIDDKLRAMSGYRFALCFENCVFPGYVTEKIFDCFWAGCIPVYWGAPDISDFVPVETFVDARQFNGWMDLDRYLREMSESETLRYSNAARDFLASEAFVKFHQDYFVAELMGILEAEFASGA